MKKPLDDSTKVFHIARGLGSKYKEFQIAMLSKAPNPSYNQFVPSLEKLEIQMAEENEEEKASQPDYNQAFFSYKDAFQGIRNQSIKKICLLK